jgi:DNA polymerase I-like protein with 3'-5' exonuclease and polymerase domains
VVEVSETRYTEAKSAADVENVVSAVAAGGVLAVAVEQQEPVAAPEEEEKEEETRDTQMSFMGGMLALGESPARAIPVLRPPRVAISAAAGSATIAILDSGQAADALRSLLTNAGVPKTIHDYKAAIHALNSRENSPSGINLAGVRHDPMLYSYLLDPTYSSHRLADVALRRFNLKLAGELAESADITGRLAGALRTEVEQAGLSKLYEEMDLPLVPVLARMERAGVKIDTAALGKMSTELEREIATKSQGRFTKRCRDGIQRGFAEATGRCAVQSYESAEAGEIRQGSHDIDGGRCAWKSLRRIIPSPAWCSITASLRS